MAGVDIGANDRWEFFLVGEPLTHVAEAESQARVGDIVICPQAHRLLHPQTPLAPEGEAASSRNSHSIRITSTRTGGTQQRRFSLVNSSKAPAVTGGNSHSTAESPPLCAEELLTCGCIQLSQGYFRLGTDALRISPSKQRNSLTKNKFNLSKQLDTMLQEHIPNADTHSSLQGEENTQVFNARHLSAMDDEIEVCYVLNKSRIQKRLASIQDTTHNRQDVSAMSEACDRNETSPNNTSNDTIEINNSTNSASDSCITVDAIKPLFLSWLRTCLADDLCRHVHEVARDSYRYKNMPRQTAIQQHLEQAQADCAQQLLAQQAASLLAAPLTSPDQHTQLLSPIPSNNTTANNNNINSSGSTPSSVHSLSPSGSQKVLKTTDHHVQSTQGLALMSPSAIGFHDTFCLSDPLHTPPKATSTLSKFKSVANSVMAVNRMQKVTKNVLNLQDSSSLSAELRNVIVMFVKLDLTDMYLLVEKRMHGDLSPDSVAHLYCAARRTVNEKTSDMLLAEKLQACIAVLSDAFHAKDGQLRQFIVDDKGE